LENTSFFQPLANNLSYLLIIDFLREPR